MPCELLNLTLLCFPGSSDEGEPAAAAATTEEEEEEEEEESMEDPLTMGPPAHDQPLLAAEAAGEDSAMRLRTHHELMPVPPEIELRDPGSGVWSRQPIPRGNRYGPFRGKWIPEPVDLRYAWEVSTTSIYHLSYIRGIFGQCKGSMPTQNCEEFW